MYTVKKVSDISGVSIKTLHHYHKIELLIPDEITDKGYRLYSDDNVQRLQQILVYKKLSFSLEEIEEMLIDNCDRKVCLEKQLIKIQDKQKEYKLIKENIVKSIDVIDNEKNIELSELFSGLKD